MLLRPSASQGLNGWAWWVGGSGGVPNEEMSQKQNVQSSNHCKPSKTTESNLCSKAFEENFVCCKFSIHRLLQLNPIYLIFVSQECIGFPVSPNPSRPAEPCPHRSCESWRIDSGSKCNHTVDGRNPNHQLLGGLSVYPIISRVSTIPGAAGFPPSTVWPQNDAKWGWFWLLWAIIMVLHVNSPKHTPKHRVTTVQNLINNIHLTKYHEISWNVIDEQESLMRLMDSQNKINYISPCEFHMIPRFFDRVNIPQGGAPQVIGGFIIPWKLVRYITNKNPSEIGVINAPTKNAIERPGAPSCILVFFQHHHIPIKWLVYTLWKPLLISLWTTIHHY